MTFWQTKTLSQMNDAEWESLCDGCGKCCLHKLKDVDTGEVFYTQVACRLLDLPTCKCKAYPQRTEHVPDCLVLRRHLASGFSYLPTTCAYRLIAEGKELASWHPLVSGNKDSVFEAGVAIRSYAVAETHGQDLQDYIIDWIC
jgi:uncharacterized cysteine cluster protein YcgN (CxxCxxCC family)